MDKKVLLKKLENLYSIKEISKGFSSQQEAISWSNKVAPLLKRVNNQLYINFIANSHKLNLPLSSFTLEPALNIMKSQLEMAIEDIKIRIENEDGLAEEMYFSPGSHLDIQKNLATDSSNKRLVQTKTYRC